MIWFALVGKKKFSFCPWYATSPQDMEWTVDLPWPSLNFWTTLSMRSEKTQRIFHKTHFYLCAHSVCLYNLFPFWSFHSLFVLSRPLNCHLGSSPMTSRTLWQNGELPKKSPLLLSVFMQKLIVGCIRYWELKVLCFPPWGHQLVLAEITRKNKSNNDYNFIYIKLYTKTKSQSS